MKLIVPKYLHGHSGRIQHHDQFRVENQDHPSTEEFEQEHQGRVLKEFQ